MQATTGFAWLATNPSPKRDYALYLGRGTVSAVRTTQDLNWMLTGKRWGRDEAGEAAGTGGPALLNSQTCASSIFWTSLLPIAPTRCSTTWPPLKSSKVGMPRTL